MTFLDQYRSGGPVMVETIEGYRSLLMGFVQFDDGVAWCSDGVLNDWNPTNPFHYHHGPVIEHGWALHCANARFMPIDRWHRYAARHWEQAVRIKPDMVGLRRKMEAMLREEFAGHHERGLRE
jgi:hypothetical protein